MKGKRPDKVVKDIRRKVKEAAAAAGKDASAPADAAEAEGPPKVDAALRRKARRLAKRRGRMARK